MSDHDHGHHHEQAHGHHHEQAHGHHHEQVHGHQHGHAMFDTPEMAANTELEGEVLAALVDDMIDVVAVACEAHGVLVGRVLDVGAGPGFGTCRLAARFGNAAVTAADGSALMLERAAARAARFGLADRVTTRTVEMPDGLDELAPADVVWASLVVHHLGDEVDGLRRMRRLVAPGGLLAVVERAGPMRVLPDSVDLGRPGLWERLDRAWTGWFRGMRAELPDATETPAGYGAMLADVGYEVLVDRVMETVVAGPLDDAARRLAFRHLSRTRQQLEPWADPADLAAVDPLLDEHSEAGILHRPDAELRASRQLLVARPIVAV